MAELDRAKESYPLLSSEPLDEVEKHPCCSLELCAEHSLRVTDEPRLEYRDVPRRLYREAPEAHEQRTAARFSVRDDRPMTKEPKQIEKPSSQPVEPQPHGELAYTHAPGGIRKALTTYHGPDRGEDDLDAAHLARQRIPRKDTLAVPTHAAARECDQEHHEPRNSVELSPNTSPGQRQSLAAASCTAASDENLRPRTGDQRLVSGRVHGEYVNHVLGSRRPR